jgi:UDP-N-acetylglucosamine 3-dehydrogenase
MIRVGVVGLGAMGQHHARLYSQLDCELVGVADLDFQRAKEIGAKYHTDSYSDFRSLLGKVDALSIVVPTSLHHEVAMASLQAGVHCLVEKPISFTLSEADDMIQAAADNQVQLAIGHIERFNPAVVKLKEIVNAGTLGRLLIISTRRVGPFVPRIRDVGVVIDSATHDIGVIRYLLGEEPVNMFSRVGRLRHAKEDHAIIVLDFASATACIEVNWFTPHKVRTLVATGSEGIAYLDYIAQEVRVCNSHAEETVNVAKAEPLRIELEDFLNSVTEGRKPAIDGVEGKAILGIALRSCRSNLRDLSCYAKGGNGGGQTDPLRHLTKLSS